jgi:hypothetical protein
MHNRVLAFAAFLSLSVGAFAQSTPTAVLTAAKPVANAELGQSVAMSGSTVATPGLIQISEQQLESVVFVYTKPSSAPWTNMTQSATLVAPGDAFNQSVAMNGDGSIIVSSGTQGAYVFVKPQGGWQGTVNPSALLTPGPAPKPWVLQGNPGAVAINAQGNTIIAGAPSAGYAEHRSGGVKIPASPIVGAAYIFVEPEGGWANMTATAKLTASDGVAGDRFGSTVGISANTVAIGAWGVSNFTGAAYIYNRPANGKWVSTEHFRSRLAVASEQPNDDFGLFLAIGNSGALVAVGDIEGCAASNPGHAFVYTRPAHSGWTAAPSPTATLTPSDLSGQGCFGRVSVGESAGNEVVVVGAPTAGGDNQPGAAYVFAEPVTGWADASASASFSPGNVPFATLGYASSVGGKTFAISAPNVGENGVKFAGVVYLFSN